MPLQSRRSLPPGLLRRLRSLHPRDIGPLLSRGLRGRRETVGIYATDLENAKEFARFCHRDSTASGSSVEWTLLRKEDGYRLTEYCALLGSYGGVTQAQTEGFLDRGGEIFAAVSKGAVVGAVSMAFGAHPLWGFEADVLPAEGQVYFFNLYVAPEWRARSMPYVLRGKAMKHCRDKGYRWVMGAIYESNTASIRLGESMGARKFGLLTMSERFFLRRYRFSREHDIPGFSFALRLYRGGMVRYGSA